METQEYTVRPLGPDTWDAFAALVEKHNGVWGGCWCTWFHREPGEKGRGVEGNRENKRDRVLSGDAHAALVFAGEAAIGWCEYGSVRELPNINHKKEYQAGLQEPPDYRLTCFFVDRDHRRRGVAAVALRGAVELIAVRGGGLVEAYPQDTGGAKEKASFLYNGTRGMFEQAGFSYQRPVGTKHCVMRRTVAPSG